MRKRLSIDQDTLNSGYYCTICIDIGTSRSGFCYALIDQDSYPEACVYQTWENQPAGYAKTPTVLAYHKNGTIEYGWPAHDNYDITLENYPEGLIRNFKMDIHPFKEKHKSGKKTMDLVTDYLRLIKNLALKIIFTDNGLSIKENILWRISIPAIYMAEPRAKHRMVEAAIGAGIIKEHDESILVSEPEMAAVHCNFYSELLEPGKSFLVVDAGGGTVDITSYKVVPKQTGSNPLESLRSFFLQKETVPKQTGSNYSLEELTTTSSGDSADKYKCGSTYLDMYFFEHLMNMFGSTVVSNFLNNNDQGTMRLYRAWERFKITNTDPQKDNFLFEMPVGFYNYVKDNGNLKKLNMYITFSKDELMKIFAPVFNNVCKCIDEHLEQAKNKAINFDYLFLVGGFGRSGLLKQLITEKYGKQLTIVLPRDPEQAVLKGAVIYALSPSIIHSRKSSLTYGTDVSEPFEEGIDNPAYKKETDLGILCKNRFNCFIRKGQDVPNKHTITKIYTPVYTNQTKMRFIVGHSDHIPRYIDACSDQKEFTIDLPGTGLDREVEVTFRLDGQRINVVAKYKGEIMGQTQVFLKSFYSK
jgi:molecular chaperone DnaK (HSP70)